MVMDMVMVAGTYIKEVQPAVVFQGVGPGLG
jgi:hypothetical protein